MFTPVKTRTSSETALGTTGGVPPVPAPSASPIIGVQPTYEYVLNAKKKVVVLAAHLQALKRYNRPELASHIARLQGRIDSLMHSLSFVEIANAISVPGYPPAI